VRAFNAINSGPLAHEAFPQARAPRHSAREQRCGGDADRGAARDRRGFDPVPVGDLSRAREFDYGTPVYVQNMTAAELRKSLKLK
jgi:predicted dinucleotide-binding enzyme